MRPTTLLLVGSLAANAGLLALYLTRAPSPPPASTLVQTAPGGVGAGTAAADAAALRAALASGDSAALVAAGVSPEVARHLAAGRALARFAERSAGARDSGDDRWWRNRPRGGHREHQLVAQRELSDALITAFGFDPLNVGSGGDDAKFAFLPPAKREALRRILQDYDEMFARFSSDGVQLASDREKLDLLRAERDRDIAALLTPAERAAYEMRTSTTAANVQARYGDAIATEEEFKAIYALQKAFDERFPRETFTGRIPAELMQQRAEAERQLQQDIRAALGEDRYAELRRASDPDLRMIDSLVSRLSLPASTTDQIASARDSLAAQSQRINSDATLAPQDRRAQIQELGTRARSELAQTLGAEAADAYAQRSSWLNMLQGGIAFATDPRDATGPGVFRGGSVSVFPVMPPPGSAEPGMRQIVNIAPPDGAPAGGTGAFMTPAFGAGIGAADTVQVISPTGSGSAAPGAAPARPGGAGTRVPAQSPGSAGAAPTPPKQ